MGANGHNGKVNGHAHQGANGTNGAHGDPRKIRDQVVISVVAIDADAPSPIPHVPIFDPEHAYDVRKLRCRHYDQCLLRAIANKWRGFSCGACRAYAELDLEGLRSDMEGFAELLARHSDLDNYGQVVRGGGDLGVDDGA